MFQDFRNFLQRVMLGLVSLCSAVFQSSTPLQMKFLEHVPIQSRSTLNTKCVHNHVIELL
jgi:hypothetical protein